MPRPAEIFPRVLALAAILCVCCCVCQGQTACAPQPEPASTPVQRALDANNRLEAYNLAEAASLASEDPHTPEATFASAHADYIRILILIGRSRDALTAAQHAAATYPQNALLLDALGEARFARGEIPEAADAYAASLKLDNCSARTHYDISRYNHLNTQFLSESKQLAVAHQLAPHDKLIANAVKHADRPPTATAITRIHQELDSGKLTEDRRLEALKYVQKLEALSKGSCHVAQPVEKATIKIDPGLNGTLLHRGGGALVPMQINGKPAKPELDTGASGLILSSKIAAAAGLISEAESTSFGIGSGSDATESLAHADSIRIGDIEFRDCLVRILKENRLHADGLIGPDVFSSWVVTIDVPQSQLRLSPLPPRPDETTQTASLDTSGSGTTDTAATPRNRYTPPEFSSWTPVYRNRHMLIFPTSINGGPQRLFLMDTGASDQGLLSLDAAEETTNFGQTQHMVSGISGRVTSVKDAMDVTLTFGHIREKLYHVPAVDLSRMGRDVGAEISGLIGFTTLRELIIAIDYRDSLVNVTYDPKHGTHSR